MQYSSTTFCYLFTFKLLTGCWTNSLPSPSLTWFPIWLIYCTHVYFKILGNVAINYLVYKRFGTGSSNESWSRRRSPGGRDGDVSMYTYVLETLDLSGGVCVLLYPLPATLIYTLSTSRCNAKIDRGAGFSWTMTSQAAGLCIMNWRSLILSSYMSSTKPTPRLLLLVLVWMFSKFNYQSTPSSAM